MRVSEVVQMPPSAGPRADRWAKPFVWQDPATLARRHWLYGAHYLRKFVTTTVAPGGLGKSALGLTEAIAMIVNRDLLGIQPDEADIRVWYWNGEDPLEEIQRRVTAIIMHYGLNPSDIEGRLFIGSGREQSLIIATQNHDGAIVAEPVISDLVDMFVHLRIDLAIIDPFVASHSVSENDNGAIAAVAQAWGKVAEKTEASVELIHHVRKGVRGEGNDG